MLNMEIIKSKECTYTTLSWKTTVDAEVSQLRVSNTGLGLLTRNNISGPSDNI